MSGSILEASARKTAVASLNAEDLQADYRFFVAEARFFDPIDPCTAVLHQRYLRAAVFALTAHAESVVNGWLKSVLDGRAVGFLYSNMQRDCLENKIEYLLEVAGTSTTSGKREMRRTAMLLMHLRAGYEPEKSHALTLASVERTRRELENWLTGIESALDLANPRQAVLVA